VSGRKRLSLLWAVGLWAGLLAGIVVAWSPRYWAVSVAIASISIVAVCRLAAGLFNNERLFDVRETESRNRVRIWQTALVALIGAWGLLQIAFRTTVLPQSTLDSASVWGLSAGAFFLGSWLLRDRDSRKVFLKLMLWSLTALAVIAMLQFYSTPLRVFGIFPAGETVVGTFLSANQFAALMELAAPMALWYTLGRNPMTGILCYAMILAATITAASRAGVILLCAELMVFLGIVLIAQRREARAIVSIFAGLAVLAAVVSIIAGTDKMRARFADRNPYEVRRELFTSTLKLIAERPWFGSGMGTWRAVYPHVATFDMALLANEAHNDWAQWTSDGGIPFLLLMGALAIGLARSAIRSIWGLGTLSVMLHAWVDYPLREPALSFLWFALAGAVSQFEARNSEIGGSIHAFRRELSGSLPGSRTINPYIDRHHIDKHESPT
jgi:O-antigen ligase